MADRSNKQTAIATNPAFDAEETVAQTRQALAASAREVARFEALFRAAVDSADCAILVTDAAGRVQDFNELFLQLWRLPREAVEHKQHQAILELTSQHVPDPVAFTRRVNEIQAGQGEAFDELQLTDGRIIERVSKFQLVEGQPAGRLWIFRDAADRRRAEELRSHLEAVVESADDAIISKTLQGVITTWNAGAQKTFGFTAAEAIGQPITILIPPERSAEETEILSRLKRGERIEHFETERQRKDGSRVLVSLTVSPVKDASGRVIGASKIARDISEQKLAEDLRARLAAVVESSDDAIISKDLNSIITSWNAAAERIFGYTRAEAVGQPITMLFPEDQRNEEHGILQRIRRGERIEHYQAERIRKDGVKIIVSLTVSPIKNRHGEVIGASKIARDISEQRARDVALRASEARLRAVVDATPDCVKIVAADGTLRYMNRAGLGMLECGDDVSVEGASVFEVIAPEHRPTFIENHRRVCAGERLSWEFEIIGLQGTRRWMETHAVPLVQADGQLAHLAVTREITARKRGEQEREELLISERAARSEAERAGRLKDEFLATLSHELRTPLNAILGWAQLLTTHREQADLQQGLEVIQRNARAQTKLIDDLLDMSRIVSGKVRLDVQWTDLASVVEAAASSVKPSADAKGIRLRKIIDPLVGPVSGDPTRLQQIVWNLLTNAIKFTPKGGSVDVLLERVHSHLEITVHDSGIGIKPEFLPLVFERFRQADSSTTRAYGGLGLGLSIVKHLVELHGGTVRVESAGENQGATFTVCLPLAPLRNQDQRRHPQAQQTAVLQDFQVSLDGVKVLVIDDELDARLLVARLLTEHSADVRVAGGVDEGLKLVGEFQPHVIISDIGMPGKDGYQFIRDLRNLPVDRGGRVPAIALTAFARSEDRTRAILAGYQMHISKPIEPQELLATVSSLVGRTATWGEPA